MVFGWLSKRSRAKRAGAYLARYPEDRPAVDAILVSVDMLGAKNARAVAQMTAGRAIPDREWDAISHRWTRAWDAIIR